MNCKIPVICLTLAIVLLLVACEKNLVEIDSIPITPNLNTFQLVVEGGITSQYGNQYIRLTKPQSPKAAGIPEPIHGATVYVSDGTIIIPFAEMQEQNGLYSSQNTMAGTVNHYYQLHISYLGQSYIAGDSLVQGNEITEFIPASSLDNLGEFITIAINQHTFGFNQPAIRYYIPSETIGSNTQIPNPYSNRKLLLEWDGFTFYQHRNSPPQGIFPNDYKIFGIGGNARDTILVMQFSLSETCYNYLVSLLNETDWDGGFFTSNHSNIVSNLSKGATGFFRATHITQKKMALEQFQSIY